jgi:RNA polymerase sigma factor (sigma-70 family)
MSHAAPDLLLQELQRLLGAGSLSAAADSALLHRFAQQRDEVAFAELVRRHGQLVFAVARRIAGHSHDAEDVFQATFLVLARKANSLQQVAVLGAWLHGVAVRLARKAVVAAARRRRREQLAALPVLFVPVEGEGELRQWLDVEIVRLPETLRLPLLLCALEGQTQEQAARQLGWPARTLKARLSRARELLRRRLRQRGVPATALTAGAIGSGEGVPAALGDSTVRLAVLFASDTAGGAGSASVLALAEGGLGWWMRLKALLALLLVVGLVGAGALLLRSSGEAPAKQGAKAQEAATKDLYGDPLPPGAVVRLGTVRFRHPGFRVQGLAFSRDGKTLLSASSEDVRIWEASSGRLIRTLPGDKADVLGAAVSPDGQMVAIGESRREKNGAPSIGLIRILNASTGKEVRRFSRGTDSMAFTPDGKLLASLSPAGILRLEEIATGTEVLRHRFASPGGRIALSPDGSCLAVSQGLNPSKLFLWEWQAGKEPREIKANPPGAHFFAISPGGKVLATGPEGWEGIRLWDVASGRLLGRLGERNEWDRGAVCFSPDGQHLAATSLRHKGLLLYDVKTGKEARRMAGLRFWANGPVFSPDGKRLAGFGDGIGVLHVWDVATGKDLIPDEAAHREAPSIVMLLKDGLAVTAGDDGTVRLWDSATGKQKRKFEMMYHMLRAAAISPDRRWLATSELGEQHSVRLWELPSGREVYRLMGHGRLGGARAVAFTPDGQRFASWGDDMYLRLWDVGKGKAILEHEVCPDGRPIPEEGENNLPWSMGVFSRDASLLAVAQQGLFVFDVKSGKQTAKLAGDVGNFLALAISRNNKYLLASIWGSTKSKVKRSTIDGPFVCVYDLATNKVVRQILLPKETIGAVALAPDGKSFAVRVEGRILLYQTATGNPAGVISNVPERVHSLAFSTDGKRLIAGLWDTTAVIWNVPVK